MKESKHNKVLSRTMLAFKAPDNNRRSDNNTGRNNQKSASKFPDNEYYLNDSIPENIDTVILAGCDFKEIFNKTKAESPICIKRLPVVKITFNGKSIHRRFYGNNDLGKKGKDRKHVGEYAALNYSSLYELVGENPDEIKGKAVQISKGRRLPYYWNHPFHATRISFRLGLISIGIAVVSLLLSLFCNLPIIHQ
ncbi:MAG: hypothetical protein KBS55_00395 [Bacteroidales bacterium]|nr:hypothetical protein [Candidatus Cryptobacteroides aphodequi]